MKYMKSLHGLIMGCTHTDIAVTRRTWLHGWYCILSWHSLLDTDSSLMQHVANNTDFIYSNIAVILYM